MIRKTLHLFLTVCMLLCLTACKMTVTDSNSTNYNLTTELTHSENNKVSSKPQNSNNSTSTQSKSETIGETSRINSEKNKSPSKPQNSKNSNSTQSKSEIIGETSRTEFESDEVLSEPEDSKKTSDTQSVYLHTHNYSEATCTTPKKCSCGVIEGDELGHLYSGEYCSRCGISNPDYNKSEWTLQLPNYPQEISYYSKSGQLRSTIRITNITYRTYKLFGEREIMVYFYGEKIYDYKGEGQYTDCKINYRLYRPDGRSETLEECTSHISGIAVGDTFAKSESILYDKNKWIDEGNYRLEIMDSYY